MKRFFFVIGILILNSLGAVDAKEVNILFVGNSFTYRHDLSQLVKEVFEEGQPGLTVNVEQIIYGGQDLFRHHDLYFSDTAVRLDSITIPEIEERIAAIESMLAMKEKPAFYDDYWERAGLNPRPLPKNHLKTAVMIQNMLRQRIEKGERVKWDYLVLQSWLDVVDDVDAGYGEYAQKWAKLAEREGIKVILYITAPHAQNQEPVTEPLGLERTEMEMKTIQLLAERIKPHAVVPVALGIKNIQQGGTDLKFRYVNDGHPNQYSAFLAANMFYAAFFKESTEGFAFDTVVENKDKGKGKGKDPDGGDAKVVFEDSTKLLLQRTAYEAVMEFYADKTNRITLENAKPGTRDWLLTKTEVIMNEPVELWRSPRIEGYCSETSVAAGETLKVMVSTNPVSEFDLEIFRTGYYGGTGGRFMKKFTSIQGKTQPDPPIGENRLRECTWEASVEFEIPKDWLSGVYLGKLTAKEGDYQSYVIFIVRDDRPCDLLFQCSDTTWAAYNSWPTNEWSLYHNDANGYTGARKRKKWSTNANDTGWVSFDRPYGQFCQDHLVDRPSSVGSGEFLLWEFPLSYWMEKQGYDVSYISNLDTHRHGERLLRTKGFISVGHDEYWTREMYDNAMTARDTGVNLAFLSGNSVWGVVPLLPSGEGQPHRVMRRESVYVGEEIYKELQEQRGTKYPPGPDGALLMGGRMAGIGGGHWTCTNPGHWLYEGTGMEEGDTVEGLIGWEWHGEPLPDLPGLEIVANGEMNSGKEGVKPHFGTFYDGPMGNIVFNSGTIWWAQGLSSPPGHVLPAHWHAKPQGPDPRVQRMTANVFDRFIK